MVSVSSQRSLVTITTEKFSQLWTFYTHSEKNRRGINTHKQTSDKGTYFSELGQIKKETSKSDVQTTLFSSIQRSPSKYVYKCPRSLSWFLPLFLLGPKGKPLPPSIGNVLHRMTRHRCSFPIKWTFGLVLSFGLSASPGRWKKWNYPNEASQILLQVRPKMNCVFLCKSRSI